MANMTRKEICILHTLVEVKSKRMPKEDAFKEAKRQRYEDKMSIEYLEDIYKVSQLLYERFAWFREGSHATTLALQRTTI